MKTGLYFQDPKYAVGDVRPDFIFDPSLVLYLPLYKLNGASFMSKDAYGHLGTVTGALWTPRGRDFDSIDDEVNCGNKASLNITQALTLEAWIKTADTGLSPIIVKWRSAAGKRAYELLVQANLLKLGMSDDGDATITAQSAAAVNDDLLHHVGGVYDGTNMKTYIDGLEDTDSVSGAVPSSINVTTQEVEVGNDGNGFFEGLIGEVRIYNRALTPLEIQHNYLVTKWRYQ